MTAVPATTVVWDAPPSTDYPVRYDVPAADRQSRWKVALRLFLALPHLIALYFCLYLAELITVVAWLIGVFSGNYEPGLAALPIACLRWEARVLTYVGLLRDEYPSFTGAAYPMRFDVTLQTRQSRASIFFRGLLVLPHIIVLYVLWTVWLASVALAWFALLISGRYPEGLRRLVMGLNRWTLRVVAYTLLLRGDYPPFSLGIGEQAPDEFIPALIANDVPTIAVSDLAWPAQPASLEPPLSPPYAADTQVALESTVPAAMASPEPPAATVPAPPAATVFFPLPGREQAAQPDAPPSDPAADSDAGDVAGPTFFRPRREPPQS
jgi:hypothetical protein